MHHAELRREERQEIEKRFSSGQYIGLLSTQTLELGIDIDDVGVVVQYKPPRYAESFVQRIGRAGRKPSSFYITLGVLTLSSIDTAYLAEDYAEKLLFEVKPREPPYRNRSMLLSVILRYILYYLPRYSKDGIKLSRALLHPLDYAPGEGEYELRIFEKRYGGLLNKLIDMLEHERLRKSIVASVAQMYGGLVSESLVDQAYEEIYQDLSPVLRTPLTNDEINAINRILEEFRDYIYDLYYQCKKHLEVEKEKAAILLQIVENLRPLLDDFSENTDHLLRDCTKHGEKEKCNALKKLRAALEAYMRGRTHTSIARVLKLEKCRNVRYLISGRYLGGADTILRELSEEARTACNMFFNSLKRICNMSS